SLSSSSSIAMKAISSTGIGMAEQRDKSLNSLAMPINCLTCDVIFCGSSAIASRAVYASGNTVRHCCHINFSLSPRRPGSAGKTSITPDYIHADGRVHYGHPIVVDIHQESLADFVHVFLVTSSSENSSPQPVAATSSMGVVFMDGSQSVDHFSSDLRLDRLGLLDLLTLFKGSSSRILASFKQSSQKHTS
nr:hypothetical protein [Tanacetum cinerariifolium]